MKRFKTEINGQQYVGLIEKIKGTPWVHLNGKTYSYKSEAESYAAGSGTVSADPGTIQAPMPGKIVKALCKVGDAVEQGQILVAMEAMKMEYALKAERDGVVASVNCTAGEQVELGQALVVIEDTDG